MRLAFDEPPIISARADRPPLSTITDQMSTASRGRDRQSGGTIDGFRTAGVNRDGASGAIDDDVCTTRLGRGGSRKVDRLGRRVGIDHHIVGGEKSVSRAGRCASRPRRVVKPGNSNPSSGKGEGRSPPRIRYAWLRADDVV